ncbi:YncE family protein, partial [Rhodococcus erythropolis]
GTVPVGNRPAGVAITPNGARVYVTNVVGDSVSVINTVTDTVTATIPVGNSPSAVAITPNGAHAYVTNTVGNSMSAIDTTSDTVTATVPVGHSPGGVAITPNGTHAYVTNRGWQLGVGDLHRHQHWCRCPDSGRSRPAWSGDHPERRPRVCHQLQCGRRVGDLDQLRVHGLAVQFR